MNVDRQHKLVRRWHFTDAAVHPCRDIALQCTVGQWASR